MMEIQKLVREQKENLTNPVTQADFLEAIKKVKGSVSETDLERYTKWMEEYGAN
jgi:SpoVK/Ycf46/Vps4 family AAA+-type ATPase